MQNIKFTVDNIFKINKQLKANKRLIIVNYMKGKMKGYLALLAVIKNRTGVVSRTKNKTGIGINFCRECKNWFYDKRRNSLCKNCIKAKCVYKKIIYLLKKEKEEELKYKNNPKKLQKLRKERKFRKQLSIKCYGDKTKYKRLLFNHNMSKSYNRNKVNLRYRLNIRMSHLIYNSLKKNKNNRHWGDLIDYNLDELKERLNKTMPKGYSWNDFQNGNKLHIDHIIPQRVFKFKKPEDKEFKMCWSLYNLRLLPASKNTRKWAYLDNPLLLYLLIKYGGKEK